MDVEIWSDIACPWCYVGKKRFEQALARFAHADEVTVTWRSFELDPEAPADRGLPHAELIARKYGRTLEEVAAMDAQLTEVAAAEGIDLQLARARSGNTFDGHRLVHLAKAHGLGEPMKERLFRAYFTDGELIADHATLERAAADVGLPADEVREVLLTERYAEEVREDELMARSAGISAVPCFVIDRRFGASGAQPPEELVRFLEHGWSQREPAPVG